MKSHFTMRGKSEVINDQSARLIFEHAVHASRLRLSIDQACGTDLDRVLDERREAVRRTCAIEDQVALGELLADLREFSDADGTYMQALRNYRDVSPFPVAWVCFQLGMLWGELVPEPRTTCATQWYEKALERLPSYTKARVSVRARRRSDDSSLRKIGAQS
jgi:hypothetical protein